MIPRLQHTAFTPTFHHNKCCNEGCLAREHTLKLWGKKLNDAVEKSMLFKFIFDLDDIVTAKEILL
jgi:hypothetical protein